MTETAFLQYTGYVLAFFAVWIVARCARSMLSERYVPEVWGYLELPDGTSRAIEHWECILGRAKASDIVLTGEGIERSHAAIQRSGAGEWTLSALDGGRGVWLNGKAVTGDAPLRGGDTLKLGEMELHFLALDDAQRATLQRKRPLTGHKVQPAVTLLLLVCFQLVLLFQFFFTTDGAALAYIVLSFGLLIAMEWFCYFVMRSISVRGFEPETLAFFLTSVGFSVVGSSAPDGMGRHCLLFLAALALFFALGVWLRDLHRVRAMRWPMAFAALGFLALNLLLSETIWGAKNWLSIAGQTLQPSEFVKLACIIVIAKYLENNTDPMGDLKGTMRLILLMAIPWGLTLVQGEMGSVLVMIFVFGVMMFFGGIRIRTLVGILAAGVIALALLYGVTMASGTDNYRLTRILSFINPELVDESATYQVTQSKIAIGSGGLKGVGMFVQGSFSQLDYVPEDWTDFIFSTIGEAWGFVGCAAVVIVYLLIILRMMYLARYTADRFGQMVILGVMAMLLFHVFENVGMTTGLMPVTGIPLPFLSYGGSNLVTNMGGIGLVLNVVKNRSITSMPGLAPQTRIRGKYTK